MFVLYIFISQGCTLYFHFFACDKIRFGLFLVLAYILAIVVQIAGELSIIFNLFENV
jgi:hypothetical protein